jgi:hypothetical protein
VKGTGVSPSKVYYSTGYLQRLQIHNTTIDA